MGTGQDEDRVTRGGIGTGHNRVGTGTGGMARVGSFHFSFSAAYALSGQRKTDFVCVSNQFLLSFTF